MSGISHPTDFVIEPSLSPIPYEGIPQADQLLGESSSPDFL